MVHVFLDTTVLRQGQTLGGATFSRLKDHAMAGRIKIHLSEISWQEFITAKQQQVDAAWDDIRRGLRKIKDLIHGNRVIQILQNTEVANADSDKSSVKAAAEYWISQANAVVHGIHDRHARRVFEKYFAGSRPFKAIKRRDDIPDAFILEAVVDACRDFSPLHFISSDNHLIESLNGIDGIRTYSRLDDFLAISEIATREITKLDWNKIINKVVGETRLLDLLKELITYRIVGWGSIKLPNGRDAEITDVVEISNIKIDIDKTVDLEWTLGIPFDAELRCAVEFHLEWHEVWGMDSDTYVTSRMPSRRGPRTCTDIIAIRMQGTLNVLVDCGTDASEREILKSLGEIINSDSAVYDSNVEVFDYTLSVAANE
ncbi:MAG TPA: PIN domain-containing protein [Pirellulaceae bacterium]|nr:PIN domain-containing protein [Pirellulaceae bacterium]